MEIEVKKNQTYKFSKTGCRICKCSHDDYVYILEVTDFYVTYCNVDEKNKPEKEFPFVMALEMFLEIIGESNG